MRHKDWLKRFWPAIERERYLPFQYGSRDCILFAARIADEISDGQYVKRALEAFQWSGEREALRLMAQGLQPLIERVMGPMIPWARLGIGDLVLIVDDRQRECLTVHDGVQLIGPADNDITIIPFRCARGGWMVS